MLWQLLVLTALLDGLCSLDASDGVVRACSAVPSNGIVTDVAKGCIRQATSGIGGGQGRNSPGPRHLRDVRDTIARQHTVAEGLQASTSTICSDTWPTGQAQGADCCIKVHPVLAVEALGADPDKALAHILAGRDLCRQRVGAWVQISSHSSTKAGSGSDCSCWCLSTTICQLPQDYKYA